jgi:hypothetical protein
MLLREIHKLIAQSIPVMEDHPYQMADANLSLPSKPLIHFRALSRGGKRNKTFMQR